jgi:hypothetical protein
MDKARERSVTEYLTTLFHELERLHPTSSATSHGIAWDDDEEKLVLLFNLGDVVLPYSLSPSDLSSDPTSAAVDLQRRARAEALKPNAALITYKR